MLAVLRPRDVEDGRCDPRTLTAFGKKIRASRRCPDLRPLWGRGLVPNLRYTFDIGPGGVAVVRRGSSTTLLSPSLDDAPGNMVILGEYGDSGGRPRRLLFLLEMLMLALRQAILYHACHRRVLLQYLLVLVGLDYVPSGRELARYKLR